MRLAPSLRYSLLATATVLFASGVPWLAARYLPGSQSLPEGVATASMRIHGGAAMAILALTGSVVALHVPGAWRERKNLASGVALGVSLIALTVTGYCLYYLGDDYARAIASLGHWLLGLTALPVFVWHILAGRLRP